jgi:hypothetical protein
MSKTLRAFAFLAAATLPFPSAMACPTLSSGRALISSSLPDPLPPDVFVADVELIGSNDLSEGIRAHVKRVIQGPSEVHELLLKASGVSNCDFPFENGRAGYLMGKLRSGTSSPAIVDPILVPVSMDRYKLPTRLRSRYKRDK